jgi:type III secretion protein T
MSPGHPEPMQGFTEVATLVGSISLTVPRIAAAFIVLPLLTGRSIPPLVRNSFLVSLAVMIYPMAAAVPPDATPIATQWPLIVIKEVFIGAGLGFLFSSIFWAVSAAGNLIDTKAGSNFAAAMDPMEGEETSLTGLLLSQLTAWLFMASCAFTLFLDLLMSSYAQWPVARMLPPLPASGQSVMIEEFSSLFTTALLLAAPAIVVLSLIDLSLGLINRYAQQLNVFTFAFPIKAWVATWIVLLSLGTFAAVVTHRLFENRGLLHVLQRVL